MAQRRLANNDICEPAKRLCTESSSGSSSLDPETASTLMNLDTADTNTWSSDLEDLPEPTSTMLTSDSAEENILHPAVLSGDLGCVVELKRERPLTKYEQYHVLTKHFVPPASYRFPPIQFGKQKRSFQHSWLNLYNGLVYSVKENGGYCKFCVLFSQAPYSVHNLSSALVTCPFTNFKKASDKLREHFSGSSSTSARKYHLQAVEIAQNFKAVMENKVLPIDQQLSSIRAQIVAENRKKISSIAETVIFCGRQGIALRGHRDDWKHMDDLPSSNPGNFLALLQFRALSGDKILAEHLRTASTHRNALYTSKTIQNEIIDICGSIIQETILAEIREARFFSIMVDEATDAANDEQLAVSIRYVNLNARCIEERFLAFSECLTGVTGSAIADHILRLLANWQLSASNLRGQTYDGAGAMAGKSRGAAARIQEAFPKAIYTHCAALALNLCVVKCCSVAEIRNMMDTAESICRFFFNSPKRQLALEKWINDCLEGERRTKLESICKTRWVERHEAFEVFIDLFEPLVCCFESIKDSDTEWNRETKAAAQSLFLALSRFPFIISLIITKDMLAYTKALSIKLQGRYVDVVSAYNHVSFVLTALKSAREDVDRVHARIYDRAVHIASAVNVQESLPRRTNRQQHRSNTPALTAPEYYKRVITIPALDYLITEIDTRFHQNSSSIVSQIVLLLPSTLVETEEVLTSVDIADLVTKYTDDLPAPESLDTCRTTLLVH